MQHCYFCGSRDLRDSTEVLRTSLPSSGIRASARVPALRCAACSESYVWGTHMEAFDLALSRELAARAVCTGEALRFMRTSLGLRAADLARLLDVTPETFSHWETGKAAVPRAPFAVVAALVDDALEGRTSTRSRLERLASPGPRPKVLRPRLDLAARPPRLRARGPRAASAGAPRARRPRLDTPRPP